MFKMKSWHLIKDHATQMKIEYIPKYCQLLSYCRIWFSIARSHEVVCVILGWFPPAETVQFLVVFLLSKCQERVTEHCLDGSYLQCLVASLGYMQVCNLRISCWHKCGFPLSFNSYLSFFSFCTFISLSTIHHFLL
jgi:hypothetical protein